MFKVDSNLIFLFDFKCFSVCYWVCQGRRRHGAVHLPLINSIAGYFCVSYWEAKLKVHPHSVAKFDMQLLGGKRPILQGRGPFFTNIFNGQIDKFE